MIDIIGVYFIPDHNDVYLIEVKVNACFSDFDIGSFTQEDPSQPRSNWQVAYDEHYLNPEGDKSIGDFLHKPKDKADTTRLAFFLYFIDFNRELMTPFGTVKLPKPITMPERLKKIIKFEEAD